MMRPRIHGIRRTPRAVRKADAANPIRAAPAATGCSIASPPIERRLRRAIHSIALAAPLGRPILSLRTARLSGNPSCVRAGLVRRMSTSTRNPPWPIPLPVVSPAVIPLGPGPAPPAARLRSWPAAPRSRGRGARAPSRDRPRRCPWRRRRLPCRASRYGCAQGSRR
jgi:hypothetical protein